MEKERDMDYSVLWLGIRVGYKNMGREGERKKE